MASANTIQPFTGQTGGFRYPKPWLAKPTWYDDRLRPGQVHAYPFQFFCYPKLQRFFQGRYGEFNIPAPEDSKIRWIVGTWFRFEMTPFEVGNLTESQVNCQAFEILKKHLPKVNLEGWPFIRLRVNRIACDYYAAARNQMFKYRNRPEDTQVWEDEKYIFSQAMWTAIPGDRRENRGRPYYGVPFRPIFEKVNYIFLCTMWW